MKYKDWNIKAKKMKTGWKATGTRTTQYGVQTITQKQPFSKTRDKAIKGVKNSIRFFYE